jgi:hypothetical protein
LLFQEIDGKDGKQESIQSSQREPRG